MGLGGRWDAGDSVEGFGLEVSGSVGYRDAGTGLGIQAQGRYLLTHAESALDEWSADLRVEWDPGLRSQGLWWSLSPQWGRGSETSGAGLWEDPSWLSASNQATGALGANETHRDAHETGNWLPERLGLETGYGLPVGNKLWKGYGGVILGEGASWHLGSGLQMSEALDLDIRLSWERQAESGETTGRSALPGVLLQSKLHW